MCKALGFRDRRVVTSAGRLVVDELGKWCPKIQISCRSDLKAEIDIAESDLQLLIKSPDLLKQRFTN
jgi:hypothetical protein